MANQASGMMTGEPGLRDDDVMTGRQGVLQEAVDVVRGGVGAADPGLDALEEDVRGVDVGLVVGVL